MVRVGFIMLVDNIIWAYIVAKIKVDFISLFPFCFEIDSILLLKDTENSCKITEKKF